MDHDKETEKTEDQKLRDLTPVKDAKGGGKPTLSPSPIKDPNPVHQPPRDPTGAR